jgi:transcriptional regulator with XRE-family HTH domain
VAEKTVVAERIRQARADRGWKQKHLAAEVSVEPITVSRWERGATTPDLQVLGLVATATGKPLSYFVGGAAEEGEASSSTLESAADRIEAAALRVAEASERMAAVASELVEELRAARSRT